MTAPELSATEVADGLASGEVVAVDVRESQEWEAGHISGAIWVPMGEIADRVAELPADRRLAMVCRSGVRSEMVADAFHAAGFDVLNMTGGMLSWVRMGLPIEPGDGHVL
ncbi:MAG: rhodanese-like domain-containing protein [Gaiellales bacterium]